MLDIPELNARVMEYRHRVFRLETLPVYTVDSDGEDFRRWQTGAPEPTWERKQPWLDFLRDESGSGKIRSRVRIFGEQLTDYERYACEFGYAYNAEAGEQIRVLRRGEHAIPAGLVERDFWTVEDDEVLLMHYDADGRFEAAEVADDPAAYITTRDHAWDAGEPFASWWARHPELLRRSAA
ncbi:MAG: hypothetical protein H0V92_07355 [Pseudonocardiales bacterium]|nr:hypothetical protein [Pseudonocardiales bacterium]